jgi:nucleoside-diphosphate-sugar epimerase
MKVVLTGVSSFTGAWFASELARSGHQVIGTIQRAVEDYPELERQRLAMARTAGVMIAERISYGSPTFAALIDRGCDVLCWHGAEVRNYRSADFDVPGAVATNLTGIAETLRRAKAAGTSRLIYTGSIGEPGEGGGTEPDRAISPYGLSKGLTWQSMCAEADHVGLPIGKFVIPNPFGMLEQERFCTYLVRAWSRGETPEVRTPDYVRDNIPVDLLARAYADFVAATSAARSAPSGYRGTQAEFTGRFAREIGPRLGLPAPFSLATQTDFSEPMVRINSDDVSGSWDESAFWDSLAEDYSGRLLGRS